MSDGAPHNLLLHPDTKVGSDVSFGANVVVHAGVVIGDGVVIQDNVVLGKRPKLAPTSAARAAGDDPLVIEAGVAICAGAIVFASARLGAGCIIGDQAFVRERASVGARSVIGRGSNVDNDVTVGDRVKVQSMVYLTAHTVVEDDVFVGPCAMTTNDDTMSRHGAGYELRGATLRRACRIGGGAVLTPGVEIGEEAFVAAGAVVTAPVAPRAVVMGVPARMVRQVADEDLLERWR
jgi:UDP-2-acetamido-3-amino-2,3-dideoxy-glucuronate N-acetyltransferase